MSIPTPPHLADTLLLLCEDARKLGARAAEAVATHTQTLTAVSRLGSPEHTEHANTLRIGVRVLWEKSEASAVATSHDPKAWQSLPQHAIDMAKIAPPQDLPELAATTPAAPALDLSSELPPPATLMTNAQTLENHARNAKGITNSMGASCNASLTTRCHVTHTGLSLSHQTSHHSQSVAVLAEANGTTSRDYAYDTARHAGDLPSLTATAEEAVARTLARRNPRTPPSGPCTVFFEPRSAQSLLSHITDAIDGMRILHQTSFLAENMHQAICPETITLTDNPHIPRGLRSSPWDDEGNPSTERTLIENGVLSSWLLDATAAHRLHLAPTGNGHRFLTGTASATPHNIILHPSQTPPETLFAEAKTGLIVHELLGSGVNLVNGNYSRGVAGTWIENGKPAYPVHEATIAGSLPHMLASLTVANDLSPRYGLDSPTIQIKGLTLAVR